MANCYMTCALYQFQFYCLEEPKLYALNILLILDLSWSFGAYLIVDLTTG